MLSKCPHLAPSQFFISFYFYDLFWTCKQEKIEHAQYILILYYMLQYISFYRFKEAFFLSLIALGKKYILKATLCERKRKWILPRMLLLWRWKWWFYSILKMVWLGRLFTIDRTYINDFFYVFQYYFQWEIVEFYSSKNLCCICGFYSQVFLPFSPFTSSSFNFFYHHYRYRSYTYLLFFGSHLENISLKIIANCYSMMLFFFIFTLFL